MSRKNRIYTNGLRGFETKSILYQKQQTQLLTKNRDNCIFRQ